MSPIIHVFPKSGVDSIRSLQPSPSILDGHNKVPLLNKTGLFLIGPKNPSGIFLASDHVFPPSDEVLITPHHSDGFGPIL
ncbi:hypothetical protein D9M71_807900 [compost metagenome]